MDILEVRKVVSRIKSNLFKKSNSYSIGMLKSHFKGTGLQFKEHRIYEHGDDVRFIDWKMLAKTEKPYLKTFEEERNVEITVVIDAGATMFYGFEGVSKIQAAIEITSLLYLIAEETQDFVRVLVLGNEVHNIEKGNGEKGIIKLVSSLQKIGLLNEDGKVNLDYFQRDPLSSDLKFRELMRHLGKKREVVILSDLNDFFDPGEFRRIVFRKNVHCFQVLAPLDRGVVKPFMFPVKAGGLMRHWKTIKVKFDLNSHDKGNPKIKPLNIEERYLENFIKEMI